MACVHHHPGASSRRSWTAGRDADREGAPLPRLALHGDLAAVRLHDMLDDREPEAGAAERAAARLVDR